MKKLKLIIVTISLTMIFSTAANAAWRTCIPSQCSQKQATFDTWRECADYQQYMGKAWAKCFQV